MAIIKIDEIDHTVSAEVAALLQEVAALLQVVSEERDKLKELAIWMTGCGYDFCQHKYFCEKRDELLK